jgi:hypothetical protein
MQASAILTSYIVFNQPLPDATMANFIPQIRETLSATDTRKLQNGDPMMNQSKRYSFTGFRQWWSRSANEAVRPPGAPSTAPKNHLGNQESILEPRMSAQSAPQFQPETFQSIPLSNQTMHYAKTLRLTSEQLVSETIYSHTHFDNARRFSLF